MLYGMLHTLLDASYSDLDWRLAQGKADHYIEIAFDFSSNVDLSPVSKKLGVHPDFNIHPFGNALLKILHDVKEFL